MNLNVVIIMLFFVMEKDDDLINIRKNDLLFKLLDTMKFTIKEGFKDIDRTDIETFSDIYVLIQNSIKSEINFNFPELKGKNAISAEALFSMLMKDLYNFEFTKKEMSEISKKI